MGTATVFTAARMLEIENASIVSGEVNANGHLILQNHGGSAIDAGDVRGADGSVANFNYASGPPNPQIGAVGDLYIDTSTGQFFKKTGALTWSLAADLVSQSDYDVDVTDLQMSFVDMQDQIDALATTQIPAVSLYRTGNIALTAGVEIVLSLPNVHAGPFGGIVHTNGMVQVKKTGWYNVSGNATFVASTSHQRRRLYVETNTIAGVGGSGAKTWGYGMLASAQGTSNKSAISVAANVYVTADTYIFLGVQTDINWTISGSYAFENSMHVVYLGA